MAASSLPNLKVVTVPVNSDNYAYLIVDQKHRVCAAVDPAEPAKLLKEVETEKCKLIAVLTTHHHADHAGGNLKMRTLVPDIKVYGGDDRVEGLTDKIGQNDTISIGDLSVLVHSAPCHTSGHVLFEVRSPDPHVPRAIFTGDTLFVGGCGRFFEGTSKDMYQNLMEKIAKLPGDTLCYVGHEYTEKNLLFALACEPQNQILKKKLEWVSLTRSQGGFTTPSTVSEELSYNPFMRVDQPEIKKFCDLSADENPIEVLAVLRKKKDAWGLGSKTV